MSTIRTNTLSNVAGTQSTAIENAINGSAKAWVNFNGTGTVAIRASYNVSSITDGGTGVYSVNFTTAMPDTNYSVISGPYDWTCLGVGESTVRLTTSIGLRSTTPSTGATIDRDFNCVSIFR